MSAMDRIGRFTMPYPSLGVPGRKIKDIFHAVAFSVALFTLIWKSEHQKAVNKFIYSVGEGTLADLSLASSSEDETEGGEVRGTVKRMREVNGNDGDSFSEGEIIGY